MAVSDILKNSCFRIPLLLSVLLLLAACSSTRFFYNRLDFFIPWYIDDYVELNDRQDDILNQLLVDYLQRHRQQYLPRYSKLLDQMLVAIEDPLTLDEVSAVYSRLDAEVSQLQSDTLAWMLLLGEDLSEQQVQEFRRNLEEQQREYEAEYLSRDEAAYRKQVFAGLKESYSDYLGRLQPQQILILHDSAGRILRLDDCWLEMRRYRLLKLEPILRRQPGWEAKVRALMNDPSIPGAAEYERRYSENLAIIFQTTVAMINSRSSKQDRRLKARLNNLRSDLLALNQQGVEQAGPDSAEQHPGNKTDCRPLNC